MSRIRPAILALGAFFSIQMFLCQNSLAAEGKWKREISLGYNKSSGNTDNSELSIVGAITKELDHADLGSKAPCCLQKSMVAC